ncbi:TetR family transcriptional regulator [Lactobacillus sp. S2-2]|uniref:TetR/AcrR family transcriptional regulator n=1 Tax=Lactobacillus sp. S2-2 TaxID=2692917 RepID=UPI001F2C5E18|nr:TetR/AcrR family transcriptional regulator [Lactobacillus sp. S2-2]MCF6515440.1 TetR family transcriptional regulator [Lactobacillus sp. S2-2]
MVLSNQLNLTTGAFYKHFKNKNELFLATAEKLSEDLFNQLNQPNTDDDVKKLLNLGNNLLDYFTKEPYLIDFLFFDQSNIKYTDQYNFKLLELVKNYIHNIVYNNHLNIDEETLFIQVWSFIQGYGMLLRNNIVTKNQEFLNKTFYQFINHEELNKNE